MDRWWIVGGSSVEGTRNFPRWLVSRNYSIIKRGASPRRTPGLRARERRGRSGQTRWEEGRRRAGASGAVSLGSAP